MHRHFFSTLAFLALIGFAAAPVMARGGHGGGGHHGGGHHGGGHHGGNHPNANHHNGHYNHHHFVNHGYNRPFTRGWYGRHPGAWGWGYGGYGWGNPWAAATLGATGAWLGMSALDRGYLGSNGSTVYSNDGTTLTSDDSEQPSDDSQTGQTAEPSFEPSASDATQLAASGTTEPANAEYMPLGVYSIAPENQGEASALLHLAVSKEGTLRGTYYDVVTDKDHTIQGALDKKTGRVAWTVAPDGKVVFETSLKDLTDQSGPVSVHFENGRTSQWTIAHYDPDYSSERSDDDQASDAEAKTGNAEQTVPPLNSDEAGHEEAE